MSHQKNNTFSKLLDYFAEDEEDEEEEIMNFEEENKKYSNSKYKNLMFDKKEIQKDCNNSLNSKQNQIFTELYSNIENNGSYLMFLAYLFIFIVLFIIPSKETKKVFFARGLLFFMTCIQCMSPISHMIMRLNYYLLVFLPIAMSYFFDEIRDPVHNQP